MKAKAIFFSLFILLIVSSCKTQTSTVLFTPLSKASIGDHCNLHVKIFQALNDKEALARDDFYDLVVKLITTEDIFYDGKRFNGDYIMVNTYSYETKKEIIKTVPVFIKASEYNKE